MNEFPAVMQRFQGQENKKFYSFTVKSDMVKRKLLKLKMNKASGIDFLMKRMLLQLAE